MNPAAPSRTRRLACLLLLFAAFSASCHHPAAAQSTDDSSGPLDASLAPMQSLIERYTADRDTLYSVYTDRLSSATRLRFTTFLTDWRKQLAQVDFNRLDQEGKADYLLFANLLNREDHQLALDDRLWQQATPLLPFAPVIFSIEDAKRAFHTPDGATSARDLDALTKTVVETRKLVEAGLKPGPAVPDKKAIQTNRITAWRAAQDLDQLRQSLKQWFNFSNGYDPTFTWWVAEPYKQADQALKDYATFLREKVAGIATDDKSTVIGTPIGREALRNQLDDQMVPYTPEELIAMARQQLAWCQDQMRKASRELGYGDDWHKALEAVKNTYVEPGKQPELIRSLAQEGEAFAEAHNLVTVPPLAKETWRMEMMSPERQLVNPFFLGGDTIIVSYPTDTMTYDQRMMSMRGNNPNFSHATVFHELIPGHWLQQYSSARYRPYRQIFDTGFWVEGNAFYWEMLYWDLGFQATPQQRIGALFWRMHRCARIIFSLSFHLGLMTPEQAIDFLVTEVGHERDNATAEVRRSFNGDYDPLYQCAYMLGALEFRALRHQMVEVGINGVKMTDRQFNDQVLQENEMPVPVLRAILTNEKLTPDWKANWRFLEEVPPPAP